LGSGPSSQRGTVRKEGGGVRTSHIHGLRVPARGIEPVGDVATVPLATPYIAGPTAMLVVVLLTDNEKFGFVEQAQTTLVPYFVLAITCTLLLVAARIQRLLGATAGDVTSRISGLILAALAVETILGGIRAFFSLPLP
jgi:multiple antibiotic resistance protein